MATQIGSSATLVGAALETTGYYYQSVVLDDLGYYLTHPLAYLVYTFAAVIAMQRFVVQQDSKMLKWLLIGPAIFAAVLASRTPAESAIWRFGPRKYDKSVVERQVASTLGDQNAAAGVATIPPSEVSSLFAGYNRIVSGLMESLVNVVASTRKDIDVKFVLRSELYSIMQSTKVDDPDFRDLLQTGFLADCREMVDAGREYTDIRKVSAQAAPWEEKFRNLRAARRTLTGGARRYVIGLRVSDRPLFDAAMTGTSDAVMTLLQQRAASDAAPAPAAPAEPTAADAQRLAEAEREVGESLSCDQIWKFSLTGLYRHAMSVGRAIVKTGKEGGVAPDDLVSDLLQVKGFDAQGQSLKDQASRLHVLYRVIAHYLLRNEMRRTALSSFINRFANRGFEFSIMRGPAESDLSFSERERNNNNEWQERTKMMFLASSLPYYQGLVLYFLAMLFPFFAVLLVIPGYHNGFIFWFILWMWAKSWEVGYAVCMLLDDVLFTIFSDGMKIRGATANVQLQSSLEATFQGFRELDPTMQLTSYYGMMSVAIGTIPIISSYLILGSLKGGAGMIASGANNFAKPFATRAAFLEGQEVVSGTRYEGAKLEQEAAQKYMRNADLGLPRYADTDVAYPNSEFYVAGANTRTVPGEALRDTANRAVDFAHRSGRLQALTSSRGPVSWLNWLTPAGAAAGMINKVVTPIADLMDEPTSRVYATLMAQYDAHLSAYSENVPFDVTNTPRVQALHARAAFNRQLFIPLLRKTGFGEEVDKEVVDYEGRFKLLASPIRAGATAAGRGTFGLLYAGVFGGQRYSESLRGMADNFPAPSRHTFPVVINVPSTMSSPIGRPLTDSDIRDEWGTRTEVHPGVDIRAGLGTGLTAVAAGEVVYSGFLGSREQGWGNTVILRHEQDGYLFYSFYAHGAFDPQLAEGSRVDSGDVILRSGNTGKSHGAHLHFGVSVWDPGRGRFLNIDPLQYLGGGSGKRRVRAREENDLIAETIAEYERRRARR